MVNNTFLYLSYLCACLSIYLCNLLMILLQEYFKFPVLYHNLKLSRLLGILQNINRLITLMTLYWSGCMCKRNQHSIQNASSESGREISHRLKLVKCSEFPWSQDHAKIFQQFDIIFHSLSQRRKHRPVWSFWCQRGTSQAQEYFQLLYHVASSV